MLENLIKYLETCTTLQNSSILGVTNKALDKLKKEFSEKYPEFDASIWNCNHIKDVEILKESDIIISVSSIDLSITKNYINRKTYLGFINRYKKLSSEQNYEIEKLSLKYDLKFSVENYTDEDCCFFGNFISHIFNFYAIYTNNVFIGFIEKYKLDEIIRKNIYDKETNNLIEFLKNYTEL